MPNLNLIAINVMYYGGKVVAAIVTLIIGLWLIGLLTKSMEKILKKSINDVTLNSFLKSIIGIFLKIVLFISVISILGIQVASFIAVLGAAGLAIGLALQGNLSNLSSGVLILFFKPFRVGEVLEFKGIVAEVKEIQIMHTVGLTDDGTKIIIPNSMLSTANLVVSQRKK
ncbi:mechanosensitive ion channel family protein [Pseudobacteroides cellulosolvens]|uniref:MscS Mechanosensitive ion channel n=1 Tax=Pseudobacteroides cellulosolvens ATCC 35603 = DSM 2933 TaxID=398512 RepID=A0A0L6JHL8_9FIRM|nr:mechanosensitive ion channel domain-containing protein [Pseudobacteroides cellulosolvens]KNY25203.1 MscS Mechanosensitive ion channel [Pseudobacteroides cellulosolvens ATCC 35603 = DSM 2933]